VFRVCMHRVAEDMAERVVEAVRHETDPRRRLTAGARAWFAFIAERRALWTALLAGGDTPLGAEAAEIRRRQARVIAGLLAEDADSRCQVAPNVAAMEFQTVVELGGKTATGFEVPTDIVAALGTSKRPAVRVSIGGHTYRSTVASMGGRFMLPLSAENRRNADVAAGDEVIVGLELDAEPRAVTRPSDLARALEAAPAAESFFSDLSYSHQLAYVAWIESAKKAETRERRVGQAIAMLGEGKKR